MNASSPQPVASYETACLQLSQTAAKSARILRDIPYGADPRQRLDIFLPPQPGLRDLPVLLFMHGGGWTIGRKEWCGFMAPPLVSLPAIFVSVGYRLIPQVAYPEPLRDCIAALRWVVDHIGAHGGSTDRIFVGGHSAGGQIAALMTMRDDLLAEAGLAPAAIAAAFCLAGTFNRRMISPERAPEHVQPDPPDAIAAGSPLALAAQATRPIFIAWGDCDDPRLERTGTQMAAALQAANCPVETLRLPGCDHFTSHLNTANATDPWTARVRAMMAG